MLFGIAAILVCQLIGEAVSHALALPIPGPVIGMVLLLVLLWLKENLVPATGSPAYYSIEKTGRYILANLSLLFVPASVGIIQKFDILTRYGWTIAIALMTSTVLALVTSAYAFMWTARLTGSKEAQE